METTLPPSVDVRIILCTRKGIPLVKRKFHPKGSKWKPPGGGSKAKDRGDFRQTARRELLGETGIEVPIEAFELIATSFNTEKNHTKHLLFARIGGDVIVPKENEEGEYVALFTLKELSALIDSDEFVEGYVELIKKSPPAYQSLILGA
jgi:ADP-ribose pyrophosphatase YjhB (NUDIX family)